MYQSIKEIQEQEIKIGTTSLVVKPDANMSEVEHRSYCWTKQSGWSKY